MKYRLTNRQQITDTVTLITLDTKESVGIDFEPGQYASLRFKRHGRWSPARCISFVNFPRNDGQLQFAMRVEGRFTSALNLLPLNSEVEVDGPFGDFIFNPRAAKHSVLLAGGIGITPIAAIIGYATRLKLDNTLTLLYSVRSQRDVPFADELLRCEAQNPNFRVVFLISEGDINRFDDKHAISGRLEASILARAARNDFANSHFFICGPSGYMDSAVSMLYEQGTPTSHIYTEAFTQTKSAGLSGRLGSIGRSLSSVYGLSALALLAMIGTVAATDITAQARKAASTAQVSPTESTGNQITTEDSTSEDRDESTATTTTPVVTPTSTATTAPVQTTPVMARQYNPPVSSVS